MDRETIFRVLDEIEKQNVVKRVSRSLFHSTSANSISLPVNEDSKWRSRDIWHWSPLSQLETAWRYLERILLVNGVFRAESTYACSEPRHAFRPMKAHTGHGPYILFKNNYISFYQGRPRGGSEPAGYQASTTEGYTPPPLINRKWHRSSLLLFSSFLFFAR